MDPPLCGSAAMSHNEFKTSEPTELQEASPMEKKLRIGKLNGIFAPVSAGAHPRNPAAWTLHRLCVPLPAPAGQLARLVGQQDPWRIRRVPRGLFCPSRPVLFFLNTSHMCSIVGAMSCHLPPRDAVRRVLVWRQLLPPMNPGIRAARCSIP